MRWSRRTWFRAGHQQLEVAIPQTGIDLILDANAKRTDNKSVIAVRSGRLWARLAKGASLCAEAGTYYCDPPLGAANVMAESCLWGTTSPVGQCSTEESAKCRLH
jgi:hypothetical protein